MKDAPENDPLRNTRRSLVERLGTPDDALDMLVQFEADLGHVAADLVNFR